MTTSEVRDYLNKYHTRIHGYICLINALQRQIDYYAPYRNSPQIYGYCEAIRDEIEKVRREMESTTGRVREWSELISNETGRKIFIDRYVHGDQWEDIQTRHSYSASAVFEKHKKACREIARKLTEKEKRKEAG